MTRQPLGAVAVLVLLLLLCSSAPAAADRVFTFSFGTLPSTENGFLNLAGTNGASKLAWGAAVGRLGNVVGWEMDAFASPGFFSTRSGGVDLVSGSQASAFVVNMMLSAPRRWMTPRLRPYGVAGGGFMKARIDDVAGVFPTDRMLKGVDVGGGVFVLPWRHGGIRGDLRYYRSERKQDPEATLGFGPSFLDVWRMSGGAVLRF
jgi:hypothetical protein